ncbi:hypothetical protein MHYP_G00333580 [Metynnis hypsauchen]
MQQDADHSSVSGVQYVLQVQVVGPLAPGVLLFDLCPHCSYGILGIFKQVTANLAGDFSCLPGDAEQTAASSFPSPLRHGRAPLSRFTNQIHPELPPA